MDTDIGDPRVPDGPANAESEVGMPGKVATAQPTAASEPAAFEPDGHAMESANVKSKVDKPGGSAEAQLKSASEHAAFEPDEQAMESVNVKSKVDKPGGSAEAQLKSASEHAALELDMPNAKSVNVAPELVVPGESEAESQKAEPASSKPGEPTATQPTAASEPAAFELDRQATESANDERKVGNPGDPATAQPKPASDLAPPAPAFAPQPGQAVRMCVCGAPNPESARFCHRCGQDISDVMPTAYAGEPVAPDVSAAADAVTESAAEAFGGALLRLESVDGLCALDVSESCTLGRGAELAEYLADKPYVSRRQAHLMLENGRAYIVHGGGRNPTCLNNRPLREGAPEELHPGDELALGGMTIDGERQTMAAYFHVRRAGDLGEC